MKNLLIWIWLLWSTLGNAQSAEKMSELWYNQAEDITCILQRAEKLDDANWWPTQYSNWEEALLVDYIVWEWTKEVVVIYNKDLHSLLNFSFSSEEWDFQKVEASNWEERKPLPEEMHKEANEFICEKMREIMQDKDPKLKRI